MIKSNICSICGKRKTLPNIDLCALCYPEHTDWEDEDEI